MKGWIEGFQASIDYIEQNLPKELNVEEIAKKAALSSFYYQRIFGALCGMTVGEYIRSRRMTIAAQELACSDRKVIDIAVKFGYDSPDSFAKAFQRFHGITPTQAREAGASLRSFAPLHINERFLPKLCERSTIPICTSWERTQRSCPVKAPLQELPR